MASQAATARIVVLEQVRFHREQAARCRRLAEASADLELVGRLRLLGAEFDQRANELQEIANRLETTAASTEALAQRIEASIGEAQRSLAQIRQRLKGNGTGET